ncbi:hypothetical protein CesoFtcFv8_024748 [Champsocephalus esox]|uniref:Uncharacterized protein n=1 Tax=Champsocephalus esox TaxID=159716 RepID=A0AAN8B700_9TELE|nr:hypothetical protein CesoFtcFv8_024748 [Champsocephalus esox]
MPPNRVRDRQAMHEAIGGRPSIDPPTLMDSATAATWPYFLAVAQHPLRLSRARPQSLARTARSVLSHPPLPVPLPEKKIKLTTVPGGRQGGVPLQPPAGSLGGSLRQIPQAI